MKAKLKIWVPTFLLALPLILAGVAKLSGVPAMHQSFSMMGLPEWFGYFIGAMELLAGIGLLVPKWSALAATGMIPILAGAIYFHLVYAVPTAIPAFVFILLALVIIMLRRKEAIWYPV
ncbi:DoxX family protein [Marinomonas sp. THO17]|uniref:DoxX family protein n=1 Tax=Marinomonas sp. THO17 TaxID=3149048 RepID=UPI00336BEEBF